MVLKDNGSHSCLMSLSGCLHVINTAREYIGTSVKMHAYLLLKQLVDA